MSNEHAVICPACWRVQPRTCTCTREGVSCHYQPDTPHVLKGAPATCVCRREDPRVDRVYAR